jgi:prepilin-type N-terminal cleavage/methylation domain-containing protein
VTSRRAFTLIEVLVIIIIIAVMASIAVPAYDRFYGRTQFMQSVGEVQDLFAEARQQAIDHDTTATVAFNGQTQTFTVTLEMPPPDTDLPVAVQETQAQQVVSASPKTQDVRLANNVAVMGFQPGDGMGASPSGSAGGGTGNGGPQVQFHGDGTSEGATLELASESGYSARMVLVGSTGQLQVEEE